MTADTFHDADGRDRFGQPHYGHGEQRSCENCRHSRPNLHGGIYCVQAREIGTAPKCRDYQEER